MSLPPEGVNPYFLGALGTLAAGATGVLLQVRAKVMHARAAAISDVKIAAHERGWLDQTDSLPRAILGRHLSDVDTTFKANNPGVSEDGVRAVADSLPSVANARRLERVRLLSLLLIPAFIIVAASGLVWPNLEWVFAAGLGIAIAAFWLLALT